MKNKVVLKVPVQYLREGETVVVSCHTLELCGYGKTLKEAHKDFKNAVEIFIEETTHHGTFDEAMKLLGWKKVDHVWKPPFEVIQSSTEQITLPA